MRRLGTVVACVGVLWVATGTGAAEAELDRGFGQDGVVQVEPPRPPVGQDHEFRAFGAGRDGSSYMVFGATPCDEEQACTDSSEVIHYGSDGTLDADFGMGGSYALPPGDEARRELAVDSAGRALIAEMSPSSVVVSRLTSNGSLDSSFGDEGSVSVACSCQHTATRLIQGHEGTLTLVIVGGEAMRSNAPPGSNSNMLIRLNEDGSFAESFGHGGVITFELCGLWRLSVWAVGKRGPIYLPGTTCTRSERPFLVRISRRGKVDRRFMRTTLRTLQPLAGVAAVVVRQHGVIDLIGGASQRTLLLRLGPNGQAQEDFGTQGYRVLPLPVVSAVRGSDGAIVAVSGEEEGSPVTLFRILPEGRLDHTFGFEEIPHSIGDFGVSIASQSGRRVLVLDQGVHVDCRGDCRGNPRLIRYLDGPAA